MKKNILGTKFISFKVTWYLLKLFVIKVYTKTFCKLFTLH